MNKLKPMKYQINQIKSNVKQSNNFKLIKINLNEIIFLKITLKSSEINSSSLKCNLI